MVLSALLETMINPAVCGEDYITWCWYILQEIKLYKQVTATVPSLHVQFVYFQRLTAFVAKSFHQAKSHIFIDDETLQRAIDWMISRQNSDGSFPEPGRVIHKNMQVQVVLMLFGLIVYNSVL
jgi:hypothetical protein